MRNVVISILATLLFCIAVAMAWNSWGGGRCLSVRAEGKPVVQVVRVEVPRPAPRVIRVVERQDPVVRTALNSSGGEVDDGWNYHVGRLPNGRPYCTIDYPGSSTVDQRAEYFRLQCASRGLDHDAHAGGP